MIFEVMTFLLAALAGPGTAALAPAPAAAPSLVHRQLIGVICWCLYIMVSPPQSDST
jgi:hypothetical protein